MGSGRKGVTRKSASSHPQTTMGGRIKDLMRRLRSDDYLTRNRAVRSIRFLNLKEAPPKLIEELVRGLRDRDEEFSSDCAEALGIFGGNVGNQALLRELKKGRITHGLVYGIGEAKLIEAVPLLGEHLLKVRPGYDLYSSTATVLGNLGDHRAFIFLVKALQNSRRSRDYPKVYVCGAIEKIVSKPENVRKLVEEMPSRTKSMVAKELIEAVLHPVIWSPMGSAPESSKESLLKTLHILGFKTEGMSELELYNNLERQLGVEQKGPSAPKSGRKLLPGKTG